MIPGTVVKSTFTGALVQYLVDLPGGLQLLVERHKPSREALFPPDTEVGVRVPVEAVLVFDAETGGRL